MLQFLMLLLPVAATCGWYYGRKSQSTAEHSQQLPNKLRKLRHDYFVGLNYLINEQPDKAVDVFIKLLEVDNDTIETHLALGSLFRRRGEVDRAIRIHQNIIARPELDKNYRNQALSELGQDYLRAGVLDRAERLFLELVELQEDKRQSLEYLLNIYQQEKDWEKAIDVTKRLQKIVNHNMYPAIAHYHCELAESTHNHDMQHSYRLLKRALDYDPQCVRANLLKAKYLMAEQDFQSALDALYQIPYQDADYLSEAIPYITKCYEKLGDESAMTRYLQSCLKQFPRTSIVIALSQCIQTLQDDKAAIEFMAEQIRLHPTLKGLAHLVELYISNSTGDTQEKLFLLRNLIHQLLEAKPVYQCIQCGYAGKSLFWLCPGCHNWNTIKPIRGIEGG